jgi:hypothetical protein
MDHRGCNGNSSNWITCNVIPVTSGWPSDPEHLADRDRDPYSSRGNRDRAGSGKPCLRPGPGRSWCLKDPGVRSISAKQNPIYIAPGPGTGKSRLPTWPVYNAALNTGFRPPWYIKFDGIVMKGINFSFCGDYVMQLSSEGIVIIIDINSCSFRYIRFAFYSFWLWSESKSWVKDMELPPQSEEKEGTSVKR